MAPFHHIDIFSRHRDPNTNSYFIPQTKLLRFYVAGWRSKKTVLFALWGWRTEKNDYVSTAWAPPEATTWQIPVRIKGEGQIYIDNHRHENIVETKEPLQWTGMALRPLSDSIIHISTPFMVGWVPRPIRRAVVKKGSLRIEPGRVRLVRAYGKEPWNQIGGNPAQHQENISRLSVQVEFYVRDRDSAYQASLWQNAYNEIENE